MIVDDDDDDVVGLVFGVLVCSNRTVHQLVQPDTVHLVFYNQNTHKTSTALIKMGSSSSKPALQAMKRKIDPDTVMGTWYVQGSDSYTFWGITPGTAWKTTSWTNKEKSKNLKLPSNTSRARKIK